MEGIEMEKTKGNKQLENKSWETKGLMHRPSEKTFKERRDWI